jgi:hypothetical protein
MAEALSPFRSALTFFDERFHTFLLLLTSRDTECLCLLEEFSSLMAKVICQVQADKAILDLLTGRGETGELCGAHASTDSRKGIASSHTHLPLSPDIFPSHSSSSSPTSAFSLLRIPSSSSATSHPSSSSSTAPTRDIHSDSPVSSPSPSLLFSPSHLLLNPSELSQSLSSSSQQPQPMTPPAHQPQAHAEMTSSTGRNRGTKRRISWKGCQLENMVRSEVLQSSPRSNISTHRPPVPVTGSHPVRAIISPRRQETLPSPSLSTIASKRKLKFNSLSHSSASSLSQSSTSPNASSRTSSVDPSGDATVTSLPTPPHLSRHSVHNLTPPFMSPPASIDSQSASLSIEPLRSFFTRSPSAPRIHGIHAIKKKGGSVIMTPVPAVEAEDTPRKRQNSDETSQTIGVRFPTHISLSTSPGESFLSLPFMFYFAYLILSPNDRKRRSLSRQ